jgi:hypothetical protein
MLVLKCSLGADNTNSECLRHEAATSNTIASNRSKIPELVPLRSVQCSLVIGESDVSRGPEKLHELIAIMVWCSRAKNKGG